MKLFEIPGLINYRADKRGNIHSNHFGPWKQLKNYLGYKGYFYVNVWTRGKVRHARVHRLVCEAFHGLPPTTKHQASHLNGIKTDNRPKNLAWATPSENKGYDSIRIGEIYKNNTTGVRGVYRRKNGYEVYCGSRRTSRKYFEDAILLRKQWEKELLESINR